MESAGRIPAQSQGRPNKRQITIHGIIFLLDFNFLKKAAIFLSISLLSKASAEIPPFPPLKKGGRRGDLGKPFQKTKFIHFLS
jgi:hypothetical protein